MKRAAYSIVHIIAWCALVYAWLIRGYEGAGNVATVLIWLLLFVSLFANTQANIRNSAKNGKTLLGGILLAVKAALAAAIIWHGHIATGVALLVATLLLAVARQEAGILGSQREKQE